MGDFKVIVKDVNDAGNTAYEDGEPAILAGHLNYLPRMHDIIKFEEKYYEVIRVIYDFDDCDSFITVVVRKWIIDPILGR